MLRVECLIYESMVSKLRSIRVVQIFVFSILLQKNPLELNSLLLKFLCYITWLDAILEALQTRSLRQILLFPRNNSLAI